MDNAYTPIDCGLHDELQLMALRRRAATLRVELTDGSPETVEGTVVDVLTRDGAEWLRLADGRTVRLDRLLEVDGRPFGR